MGACTFHVTFRGKSISNAYSNAVADAREEYGSDGYNGTISTTSGVKDVTSEFNRSGKSLDRFINDNIERCQKWGDAWGICVKEPKTNTNKVKSKVEHIVSKGTKKWVLRYVVNTNVDDEVGIGKTKGEAITIARKHTESTKQRTSVRMIKVLEKGSSEVARIEYKKGTDEADGLFVFFGWAAE